MRVFHFFVVSLLQFQKKKLLTLNASKKITQKISFGSNKKKPKRFDIVRFIKIFGFVSMNEKYSDKSKMRNNRNKINKRKKERKMNNIPSKPIDLGF